MYNKKIKIIFLFIVFFFLNIAESKDKEQFYKIKTFEYLTNINEFESKFVQIQDDVL